MKGMAPKFIASAEVDRCYILLCTTAVVARSRVVACGCRCAQGKGIVIETEESKKIKRNEEDLNGVNPFYAILGAGGAAAMSFGSWKVPKM